MLLRADAGALPLADSSVDAIVTDPPAGIAFMGRSWDKDKGGRDAWIKWLTGVMAECSRVLKPGGHAIVWALPRTSHWTATAIENAGFDIRDVKVHLFGSGFPKSQDIGKAIDKRPGVQLHREFAAHLAVRRQAAGLSRADVSERIVGTRSGACWNWERHQFPEARWWPPLRDLLGLDLEWGEVIAEAERESIGQGANAGRRPRPGNGVTIHMPGGDPLTAPATAEAEQWAGWGTALKPASEHWILARKPFPGTVAGNVLEWGTGGLNVDATRVGTDTSRGDRYNGKAPGGSSSQLSQKGTPTTRDEAWQTPAGRWPSNVLLSHAPGCVQVGTRRVKGAWGQSTRGKRDEANGYGFDAHHETVGHAAPDGTEQVPAFQCEASCPVAELDRQSGTSKSSNHVRRNTAGGQGFNGPWKDAPTGGPDDQGGASRFFPTFRYVAKASSRERSAGLPEGTRNTHPCVKPVELMRWLVRLVTPPGGIVLDCFAGSGSTGVACALEGFRFIGCDLEREYLETARARIGHATTVQAESAPTLFEVT